jgi:hydroxymethylbilane synthase
MSDVPLRIGTRASPLAMVQTELTRAALIAADPALAAPGAIEIVPIVTTGDRVQDRRLAEIGGKGLFAREIERALADRRIDLAVHSMKDVETVFDDRFVLAAVLPREDPRDALIAPGCASIGALPQGAVIGTSSLRRQAQLLHRRPDLKIVLLRGNVGTRLRKRDAGEVDATLLALAGLRRVGMESAASGVLDPEEMLPAVAQGAIAIECRADDAGLRRRLAAIDHAESSICTTAERGLLAALDGSCHTPIAAMAVLTLDGTVNLRARLLRPDGSKQWEATRSGSANDAEALGRDAGAELRGRGDQDLFAP